MDLTEYDWKEIWADPTRLVTPDEVDVVVTEHREPGRSGWAEMDLVVVLKLKDGSFASIHAGTDTTGWGCHGDYVRWYKGPTLEDIIHNGLTNESRRWLGFEVREWWDSVRG